MSVQLKVLVSRKIPQAGVDLLAQHFRLDVNTEDKAIPPAELAKRLADCDGLVCLLLDKINDELLSAAPRLRVVSNVAVGFDNFDLAALNKHRVMGTNTPGVLTDTTADFAFTLLVAAARRVVEADKYVRDGKFKEWGVELFLGQDIHHATLGILGMGRIGLGMARRARGFEMRVIYHDEYRAKPEVEKEYGLEYMPQEDVIRRSDFLSLHVPLLPSTRHLLGAPQFAMMKRTAVVVNTSRGPVIDEAALVDALKNGVIAGAGLDVFEFEPKVHPGLMSLPNAVIVPHIASASVATRTRMATMAAENCIAALEGKTPPNLVNTDVVRK
jgi:glyoxylate reductase